MLARSGTQRSEVRSDPATASPAEALTAQPPARRAGVFTAKGWAKRWDCRLMEVSRIYSVCFSRASCWVPDARSRKAREVENDGNWACCLVRPGTQRSEVRSDPATASPAEALTAQPPARRAGVFTETGWAKRWGCRLMEVSRIYCPRGVRFPPQPQSSAPSQSKSRHKRKAGVRAAPLRPERHTPNSISTIRRLIATALANRLPRCPCCLRVRHEPHRRS